MNIFSFFYPFLCSFNQLIYSFIHSLSLYATIRRWTWPSPKQFAYRPAFLPEGVAQGTHEPRGNGQVAGLPQWTEVPSPRMNASHQVEETSELPRSKPPQTGQ